MTTDAPPVALVGDGLPVPCADGLERPYLSFDMAASTSAMPPVLAAVEAFLPWYSAGHGGAGYKSQAPVLAYESSRLAALAFAGRGAHSGDVAVICRNTTEAINQLARRPGLSGGDVVATTVAEHDSNRLPWARAAACRYVGAGRTARSPPKTSRPRSASGPGRGCWPSLAPPA